MERWNGNELLLQAAEYFKKPGFRRLFEGLNERYQSLSRLGGTINISALTKEESEALEGFLQMNTPEGKELSLSVSRIRKALKNTRYGQCSLEDIVPLVLDGSMISNKQKKEEKNRELEAFLDSLEKSLQGKPVNSWRPFYSLIIADYNRDRPWAEEHIPLILRAVNSLPAHAKEYERLPVFAAGTTGNPHYFDEGKRSLTYLLYGIRHLFGEAGQKGNSAESRTELLYRGGILKDDLYNWVLCFGIRGYLAGGEFHRGMEAYLKNGEPQILTLQNISLLKSADVMEKKVYVVENPAVFSHIVSRRQGNCACICSGGQLRLSVLILLDLLVRNQVTVYYSGDFDPEGLCIAQKLVSRYGDGLRLWHYDETMYYKSVSSESISDRRLAQLKGITDSRLSAIGILLQEHRHPGYQENMIDCFD
ncbi:TIGR02679 domain-containing protein [Lacrimispora sp.]|uniref:TIGR02679 domain-containing protein n=1 Tax=Lacrimispora sp. TaxID=2719234 RepID=UPI003460037F